MDKKMSVGKLSGIILSQIVLIIGASISVETHSLLGFVLIAVGAFLNTIIAGLTNDFLRSD